MSEVYVWGRGGQGQLGLSKAEDCNEPQLLQPLQQASILSVKCGAFFSLALSDAGEVWSWGCNDHGQLGRPDDMITSTIPAPIATLRYIKSISCGVAHALALDDGGILWTWGANTWGELGLGDRASRFSPVQLDAPPGMGRIIAVTAGCHHSLIRGSAGSVLSCGKASYGRLGRMARENDNGGSYSSCMEPIDLTPLALSPDLQIVDMAAGEAHSLILLSNGKVWAWGKGTDGQLGNGTTMESASLPQLVLFPAQTQIVSIVCGYYHNGALEKQSGSLYTWGWAEFGQLGHDDVRGYVSTPRIVQSLARSRIVHIGAGAYHTMCADARQGIFAWGVGQYGQLGTGSFADETLPVKSVALKGFSVHGISCGASMTALWGTFSLQSQNPPQGNLASPSAEMSQVAKEVNRYRSNSSAAQLQTQTVIEGNKVSGWCIVSLNRVRWERRFLILHGNKLYLYQKPGQVEKLAVLSLDVSMAAVKVYEPKFTRNGIIHAMLVYTPITRVWMSLASAQDTTLWAHSISSRSHVEEENERMVNIETQIQKCMRSQARMS
jgi:alpha-tubulin suppressor-like RCC1 family protein